MKQRILVSVDIADLHHAGQFKTVFKVENVIDDCLDFDFKAVYNGLRCLYPEAFSISFKSAFKSDFSFTPLLCKTCSITGKKYSPSAVYSIFET